MATLIVTEAPGGLGDCYQCPTCGRMSLTKRVDDQGLPTSDDVEVPRACVRCKSPMDIEGSAVKTFQDKMAEEGAKQAPSTGRRTVKV